MLSMLRDDCSRALCAAEGWRWGSRGKREELPQELHISGSDLRARNVPQQSFIRALRPTAEATLALYVVELTAAVASIYTRQPADSPCCGHRSASL